ncbi:unnamed protein product, partial [Effrenium voratum]
NPAWSVAHKSMLAAGFWPRSLSPWALAPRARLPLKAPRSATGAAGSAWPARLAAAAAALRKLRRRWRDLGLEPEAVAEVVQLQEQQQELREELEECPYGDPSSTWTVPFSSAKPVQPLVAAHSEATRALLELELAQGSWQTRCAEALGHAETEPEMLANLNLDLAQLHLRLIDVPSAYQCVCRAMDLGVVNDRAVDLLDNCLMCENLKTSPSMTGLEDPSALYALYPFADRLRHLGYVLDKVLASTGAESLLDFSDESKLQAFSEGLGGVEPDDILLLFLLRKKVPLERLPLLSSGAERLLLKLQAVTAVRGHRILSPQEAARWPPARDAACFSNLRFWPLADGVIATDAQTWPHENFEPVMYLSDDSLALLDTRPDVAKLRVLDICCGSGVQGISALRRGAESVAFVDLNPRAIQFAEFNLALNKRLDRDYSFHHGDLYSALDSDQRFDLILANPPFLPNPQNIASQAVALFGHGGAGGEDVVRRLCGEELQKRLEEGGWLMMVTYAPNVEEMPGRLQRYLGRDAEIRVFGGNRQSAENFLPVASEVEAHCYTEALAEQGITSMSEAIVLVRFGEKNLASLELRDELFADRNFLESIGQMTSRAEK